MKKILLLTVLSVAVLTMQAQLAKKQPVVSKISKDLQVQKLKLDQESTNILPHKPYNDYTNAKGIQSVNKVLVGSSTNCYGILTAEQNCLTANADLNAIMFTHRKDYPLSGTENSGYIQGHYSTDGGLNWSNNIVYQHATKLGRYPSGVIYNPAGNTTLNNAYQIVAGPFTGGSGWLGSYQASMKFDGTNGNTNYIDEDETVVGYTNLPRSWMQVDNTGRIRLMGEKNTDDGTNYTSYKTTVYTGVFNTGTSAWDWTSVDLVPDFTQGTGVGPDGLRTPAMAFSDDGQTGYLIYSGRNVNAVEPDAYTPMIYKTTDGGVAWTLQPAFDWNSITAITENLTETSTPGVSRPFFGLIQDAIVDGNGKLHFSVFINSASSTHPDSLAYSWQYTSIQGIMYHCWQTTTGYDALPIDIQYGQDVTATESPITGTSGSPNVSWDNRLQMSKTPAGDKIVFGWMDTDTTFSTFNLYPDLKAQIFDINTGLASVTYNLTTGTSYDANNYFLYLSNVSFFNSATNEVTLHMTTSEFGATDADPVDHYYLTGATVMAGINEPGNGNISSVSQNYPNPFNGTTSIDISLNKTSQVNIDVINMLGQTISSSSKQLTAGTHTETISADNLKTGIYFYTVRTDNGSVTKKMIVK